MKKFKIEKENVTTEIMKHEGRGKSIKVTHQIYKLLSFDLGQWREVYSSKDIIESMNNIRTSMALNKNEWTPYEVEV